ncbi:MAG TPA: DUF4252 domain-containing protein [Terriglobales bacterium]|nr:DUF4252 domain-containing protein [Terriglobales bacterium]
MKHLVLFLTAMLLPAIAPAQEIRLPANLEKLSAKAVEVVEVNLDQKMLQLASRFMDPKDPDEQQAKRIISNLKSVYVRSYQFDKPGEYSDSDVAEIRSQLQSPVWSRIVGVRSKREHENAEIYLKSEGNQITSLVIVAADPQELTFVSIDGPINPEDLADLGGQFHIPEVEVQKPKPDKGAAK